MVATMSIITKRGDGGVTDCLYGKREPKSGLLIDAIGNLDELNAWIGYAAKLTYNGWGEEWQQEFQKHLISIMGELSAGKENFEKYNKQFGAIGKKEIERIEKLVQEHEKHAKFDGWQTPNNPWDIACRVARRAERSLYRYHEGEEHPKDAENVRKEVLIYINRLSDLLWILARK